MDDPVGYAKYANSITKRDVREVLSAHMGSMCWAPGDLVLEIGFGPGDLTTDVLIPALPADVGKVVGVDIAKEMVDHATAKHRHPKLSFAQMDIATKQLNKDKLAEMTNQHPPVGGVFDKVFSFFCLHWVPDQKQAVKNVYELMKPKGEGLFVFLSYVPVYEMYELLAENPKWKPYMKDATSYLCPYYKSEDPSAEFSAVLRHAGFEVTHCVNEKHNCLFETLSQLKGLLHSVNPFMKRIPEHLRSAYMDDWIPELRKVKSVEFFDRNNLNKGKHVVSYNYELIIAHFKKTSC